MTEFNNNRRQIQVKSFDYKWYEFLITYGIFNIFFFVNGIGAINRIYENYSNFFVSDFIMDGSNLSIFVNMFAAPLFLFFVLINIAFTVVIELIVILVLKYMYFSSTVIAEEKVRLYQYIKKAILCFILANIIGIMFWWSIVRTELYAFLYLPVPLFTYLFVCLKMKKSIKEDGFKADGIRELYRRR